MFARDPPGMSGKRQWSFQGDLKKAPQYALLGLFEDRLSVDGDFDQIADDNPALVQRRVPACAEVAAVYRSRGYEACAGFGPLSTPFSHQGVCH